MNNRKKQRNRKIILIITVTIIVFSSISLIFSRTQWGIERMISDTVAVVEYYVIKKPIEFISNLFNEYNELKDVYDENKILREQLAAYASVEVNTNVLSNEIDDLKKALDLKELTTDYNVKTATVISRDASNWTNEITIDLGSMAGVKEDMVAANFFSISSVFISNNSANWLIASFLFSKFPGTTPIEEATPSPASK